MSPLFKKIRMDRIFEEIKDRVPASELEMLTPSTVYGVVPQSQLNFRPQQALRDGYELTPAKIGDFVISMSSFKHGIEFCGLNGGISPDYTVLRPIVDSSCVQFLRYSLKSNFLIEQLTLFRSGIRQGQRLQWNRIRYVEIPIPTSEYAKEVVAFLDLKIPLIDLLITKKQRVMDLLREHRNTRITTLLTKGQNESVELINSDIPWIEAIPSHWSLKKLRHLVKIRTGGRDSENRIDDGEYPFFVRSDTIQRIDTYSIDDDAVLTSGDGAGVGKVFHHYIGKFDFHQRVYAFTHFRHISSRFFYYFLSSFFQYQMTQHSAKSTVDSVRMPFLQGMTFVIPPQNEQRSITKALDKECMKIDKSIFETGLSIEKLRDFRSALITEAVTGQLDIKQWQKRRESDRCLDIIERALAQ